jgi:nucleoside-diphosphate-sugar epimerase
MRIVVTGSEGYLGGQLGPTLQRRGHEVIGVDSGLFADCLATDPPRITTLRHDIREVPREVFEGVEAVVHLAALSNDPIGNLDARWTREINVDATVRTAELAKQAGVRRFVFASSCIMYGAADGALADETTRLDPRTEYARSKVLGEEALTALADDRFSPVFLRNGTVYGASPRLRLDTVFNDFVFSAVTTGRIVVRGGGREWRPVVDIRDVASAFAAAVEAPADRVHNEAFNTGAEHLNHRIGELAEIAASVVPGATVEVLGDPGADQRSYQAVFDKFGAVFPDVRFRDVVLGGQDLAGALRDINIAERDRFVRLSRLRQLLDSGDIDRSLRWTDK